jgi:hypothetical protein
MRRHLLAAAAALSLGALAAPAHADGPGVGTASVVTVGDSYISGEAGRWAGNTNQGESGHDALGASAYWDAGSAEAIDRCHRSKSAEAFIGVPAVNFACSGSKASSSFDGDRWKPGLDFADDGAGHVGQAKLLQDWARTHNVRMVVVSVGGNDFNFGSIVSTCVADFLYSPSWWPDYCYDDSSVTANFTAANVSAKTTAIKNALLNVRTAMANAGYSASQWTMVVQTYASPIPRSTGFRYSQSGYTRQSTGGCGFWDRDANWANDTALPTINGAVRSAISQTGMTNVRTLELANAFTGRRLCENTVGLLEEVGLSSWTATGASDRTEWVNQIRTVTTCCGNYFIQESLHPNYWGQLALRNCVRSAFNGGAVRGGTCARGSATGKNSRGEPNMTFTP